MITAKERRSPPKDAKETMTRYPLLTAHLVCESLGYFSPTAAANAILDHVRGQGSACEWYLHMAAPPTPNHFGAARPPRLSLKEVNRRTISSAFRRRHTHRGPMAEYAQARALVNRELAGGRPAIFQSW